MKKLTMFLMLTIIGGLLLAACSNDEPKVVEPTLSANEMMDELLTKIEQPMMMELTDEQVQEVYNIDPTKLADYAIRIPMMNVKSNEIAILKVKDVADVLAVEEAVKQRAQTVQQQFETYLPDQYENAKNYKVVTKGNYVLFVISDQADELVTEYDRFFNEQ